MSKLGISTGRIPNDGTGDTLLSGAVKINKNFDEIYNYFGDGTNLTFTNDGSSRWARTVLGIHTVSNVGIGTVIPRFNLEVGAVDKTGISLHVNGDAKVTGILSVGQGAILINGNNDTITSSNIVVTNRLSGSGIAGFLTSANLVGYATEGYVNTAILGLGTITSGGGESYWQSTAVGINTLSSVGIGTTNPTSKLTVQSTGSAIDGENAAHPFAIRQGTFDRTLWMGYATNIGGIGEEGAYINAASTGISRPIYISTRNLDQTPFVAIGTDRPTGTSGQMLQVTGGAYVSGNLGIGTKSPTSALTVKGNTSLETLSVSGVSTFAGITTVTGSTLFANQLSVSGIATFRGNSNTNLQIGSTGYYAGILWTGSSGVYNGTEPFILTDSELGLSISGGLGDLILGTYQENGDVIIKAGNFGPTAIKCVANLGVELYYNVGSNSKKFETIGAGVTVTGTTFTNNLSVSGVSTTTSLFVNNVTVSGVSTFNQIKFPTSIDSVNNRLAFGDSDQFHLHYNSASAAAIIQTTSNPLWLRVNDGENALIANINGSVELYYNNLKKFETRETGVTITGTTFTDELSVSGVSTFAGITTVTGPTLFAKQLNVSGVSTFTNNLGVIYTGGLNPGINLNDPSNNTLIGMYYDTSANQSYLISDQKNLNIKVRAPQDVHILAGDETMAVFESNAGVSLYYDNSNKFETLGTGVTVTGTNFTNQLSVSGVSTFAGAVGIGTTNPTSKLTVRDGDISVGVSTAHGLILTSPNGTQYRLIVDDSGALSTVAV